MINGFEQDVAGRVTARPDFKGTRRLFDQHTEAGGGGQPGHTGIFYEFRLAWIVDQIVNYRIWRKQQILRLRRSVCIRSHAKRRGIHDEGNIR